MTFFVDQAAVAELAGLTGRATDDGVAMYRHFTKHAHLSWTGEGLINLFRAGDDRNEEIVRTFLTRLTDDSLGGTTAAINAALGSYRRADARGAARLDAGLAAVDTTGTVGYGDLAGYRDYPGLFRDAAEPTRNLSDPPDYNRELPPNPSWMELVEPAGLVRRSVLEVTTLLVAIGWLDRPWDPYEVALKPLCGDWAGMATIGHVLTQEAAALGDLHQNLWWAGQDVDQAWRGHAADALTVHLDRLCGAVDRARQTLEAMSLEYFKAAHAAYEIREAVGFLITEAGDLAARLLLRLVAAGVLAASGAGLVISLIWNAFLLSDLHRIIQIGFDIITSVHQLEVTAHAFTSAAHGFGTIDGDFDLPELPATPVLIP